MTDKEKIKEELKQLYQRLYERDKEFEKAKGKRFIITMLVFTAFYFVTLMIVAGYTDIVSAIEDFFSKAILDILGILLASIMIAWFHFWINATIFSQLSAKSSEENKIIDAIKDRIKELEKKLED